MTTSRFVNDKWKGSSWLWGNLIGYYLSINYSFFSTTYNALRKKSKVRNLSSASYVYIMSKLYKCQHGCFNYFISR